MTINEQKWSFTQFFRTFFPIQLLIGHSKRNFGALSFWAVLFLFVGDKLASGFGVLFLFLSPEYQGEVSALSFYLLGFGIGGFITAFNTYSYMRLGPRFPFLTSLSRPFFKFCINNAILPLLFVIYYIVHMVQFQYTQELASTTTIITYIITWLLGVLTFIVLSFFYFFPVGSRNSKRNSTAQPIRSWTTSSTNYWYDLYELDQEETFLYIGKGFRLNQSRSIKHLDRNVIEATFAKNRINASVFELLTIGFFFFLGFFNDYSIMEVPAALSIVLLLTIVLMIFSALRSWFRGWVYLLLFGVFLGMNYLSSKTELFDYTSYAYGLDYGKPVDYNIDKIQAICMDSAAFRSSRESYIATLENWKKQTAKEKPKLVIIATSGGGSRSALWTLTVLQHCDDITHGEMTNQIQLITGASGGMIGAAYFRELLLHEKKNTIRSLSDPMYRKQMGKDMLNRLSFMASTNDIFIRYQKCHFNGMSYTKDRGFAFEQQLHDNTDDLMNHTLEYYKPLEEKAMIPTMVFTPTIINDGRRLYMGAQSLRFLTYESVSSGCENVEYYSLLDNQKAGKIEFSSVLRANATFPFVMPMVSLPTTPQVQLMDAGIRDNYGGKAAHEFIKVMADWIQENTSGVVIVQIRDTKKIMNDDQIRQLSFSDKLTMPFGNIYKNFPRVQDYNQEELYESLLDEAHFPIDVICFNLRENWSDRISLSWHLTKEERLKVENALGSPENQRSLKHLQKLLR